MAIPASDVRQGYMPNPSTIDAFLEPGVLVRHPDRPDWGVGQVQSVDAARVTVNFEDAGKQVIDAGAVRLTYLGPDPRGDGQGV
jgi:hypothetical protein